MRPCSNSRMRSAARMVLKRCAMIRQVCCEESESSADWIRASLFISRAEVASSRTTMGAFFRKARASATRCFCPPDRPAPPSPMSMSSPCSSWLVNSSTSARCAASSTSVLFDSGAPTRIFSRMEPRKSAGYWETSAMLRMRSVRLISRTFTPSIKTEPAFVS